MIAKIIVGDYHFRGSSWAGVEPLTVEFVTSLMQVRVSSLGFVVQFVIELCRPIRNEGSRPTLDPRT
jgi:hypothetical protein